MIILWRRMKASPYVRSLVSFIYLFLRNTHKNINGRDNDIQICTQANLPILKNVVLKINGNGNKIIIKGGTYLLDTKIEIHGDYNRLIIEDYCQIKGSYLWMEDSNCKLEIGKGTTFEKEVKVCVTEPNSAITIGENCLFAYGIVIRCGDSHSIVDLDTNERINYAEDIRIDSHVWIGTNAQVLKGVHIGANSIVAAGSIVTKNVPSNCIAAGVPAQVKRTKVKWLREKLPRKETLVAQIETDETGVK